MKNRYIAGILAICLGWLGFHKFYLWKWIQGIFYILFMLTFIPLLISIFEWLVYLFNTDEWFDLTYNFEYIQKQDYLNKKK